MLPSLRCINRRLEHIAPAEPDLVAGWSRSNGVALVTIAPELPGALAVIETLVDRGVVVSAGHSEATAQQTRDAMAVGLGMVTHLFNAMSPLGHRSPNLAGVALAEASLKASVIVDGIHVAPEVIAAIWNAKGPDTFVLVTDAVAAMGMKPGVYELGGRTTVATDLDVRTEGGVLAGSSLSMDRALRNLVAYTGCDAHLAGRAATITPAKAIGATDRGSLQIGACADVVLLDEHLSVQMTCCRGQLTFVGDAARGRVPEQLLEDIE